MVVAADTVVTVGNTMIVAGVVLAIVLLLRAARRGPTRPQLPPDGGISGLDRRRAQPTIQSTYGRPPRVEPPGPPRLRRRRQRPSTDTSATAPIDTSTAPTTTWRSEETWGDDRRSGDTWDTGSYDTGSYDGGSADSGSSSSGDSGGGDSGGGGGGSSD